MRASFLISIAFLLSVAPAATAQTPAPKTFDIYVVDVEGGDSVLFVSPSGESLLMDMAGGGTTIIAKSGTSGTSARLLYTL